MKYRIVEVTAPDKHYWLAERQDDNGFLFLDYTLSFVSAEDTERRLREGTSRITIKELEL